MGGVVLLGGGVLLAALLLKGNEEIKQVDVQPQTSTSPKLQAKPKQSAQEGQMVQLQPLAVDVETENVFLKNSAVLVKSCSRTRGSCCRILGYATTGRSGCSS